jgi:hypothetical protein
LNRTIRIIVALVVWAAAPSAAFADGDAYSSVAGAWRFTRSVVAPWADEAAIGAPPDWIGSMVTFGARSVKGPAPLACRHAAYEATLVAPEGLFQGNLPAPAADAMTALGLSGDAVGGVSLSCDTGVFEIHRASAGSLLVALDNRIWTLDQTAGTRATSISPEGVLQRFLEAHFAGDMAFTTASIAGKRAFLSKALFGAIEAYLAAPQDPDEAPLINGDPFTDSQEYPTRFAVGADDREAVGVELPVDFADAFTKRTVLFEMTRENGHWLVSDLRYPDGTTLSGLLAD